MKYAEESGLTPAAAASILSIIGIASTIGRVVFGRLADHRRVRMACRVWSLSRRETTLPHPNVPHTNCTANTLASDQVNRLHLYKASMLIVGAAELVLPLFQTYATLVVFALVFGTLAGSFIAIMPVGLVTAMIGWNSSCIML